MDDSFELAPIPETDLPPLPELEVGGVEEQAPAHGDPEEGASVGKPKAGRLRRVRKSMMVWKRWRRGGHAAPRGPRQARKVRPPLWQQPEELTGRAWMVTMIFLAVVAMYAWALASYYTGAHGGVDQNGYLMTSRLISGERDIGDPDVPFRPTATQPSALAGQTAEGHPPVPAIVLNPRWDWVRDHLGFVPDTPYQFGGRMDVMTEPYGPASATQPAEYRIYAKYPFGFPLMAAIGRWLGGVNGMYWVNPICTLLAVYFAYFLFRQAVSPFVALLGVIWLACNPLVLVYANDANSHASTLFCVTAGFWGLVSWMRTGSLWRGLIGGFLIGYACTIRYSEFLLVLPVLWAAAMRLRLNWREILHAAGVVAAWALPVAVLAGVCWVCYGLPWKTGYTYCNESTGFGWKYLTGDFGEHVAARTGNWETLVTQVNHLGLFVLWPFALAGLFGMLGAGRGVWRLGVTVALWVVPEMTLYMLYYWAPGGDTTTGYLRFFISMMPALIFAGMWMLERALGMLSAPVSALGPAWDARRSGGSGIGGLVLGSLIGLIILVAAGLYAQRATVIVGLAFFPQAFAAIWLLATGGQGWLGALFAWGVVAMVAGMWVFDGELVSADGIGGGRVALALGAGAITVLGCAVNLNTILPTVARIHAGEVDLRETIDNVRQHVPRGSTVMTASTRFDDQVLNDLDAVGGYRLFSASTFDAKSFTQAKRRVESADKDHDEQPDPNPVQPDRERFYMELLGRKNARGDWVAKSAQQLRAMQDALVEAEVAAGREVAFLSGPGGKGTMAVPAGMELREVARWYTTPPIPEALRGAQGFAQRNKISARRLGTLYVLYDVVKRPPKKAPAKK